MMERPQLREELIRFLVTISRQGRQLDEVDDDANLVDAGIIDSFALIQIILHLEQGHGVDLQASGIDPNDLNYINGILDAIEQGHK